MDRKTKVRQRKLDNKKPIPIRKWHEVPDLDDFVSHSYTTFDVITGVDKEEEDEHHLQAVINAAQTGSKDLYIPVPDATRPFKEYEKHYHKAVRLPRSYIKFSTKLDDLLDDTVPYNLDSDDDVFLSELHADRNFERTVEDGEFEKVMSELDRRRITDLNRLTFDNALSILPKDIICSIFEHWLGRRKSGKTVPHLKIDQKNENDSDPYTCFRKRELKATRRNRKTDLSLLLKLKMLRQDLADTCNILDLCCRREELQRRLLDYNAQCFGARCKVREMRKTLGLPDEVIDDDKPQRTEKSTIKIKTPAAVDVVSQVPKVFRSEKRKRALYGPESDTSENEEETDPDFIDITNTPFVPLPPHISTQLFVSDPHKPNMQIRRRIGRGGRVICDRRHKDPRQLTGRIRFTMPARYSSDGYLSDEDEPFLSYSYQSWITALGEPPNSLPFVMLPPAPDDML